MGTKERELCISKVPIFNHLEPDEMLAILKKSSQMTFKKGEIIYSEGDPLEYLYIVHTGRVKIYQLFESGKEQLLRILESGEFMGELALFTEKVLDGYAEALENTEICAIHRDHIQELMKTHATIPLKILSEFSMRLEETEFLVSQLSYRDVETRTASYLIKLVEENQSDQIVLPMSKRDLASHLGTTQETISRRLSHFQTNGWIEQKGHRNIKIIDREALEQASIDL
jgi:CRP/FNR family transcriptional regulator